MYNEAKGLMLRYCPTFSGRCKTKRSDLHKGTFPTVKGDPMKKFGTAGIRIGTSGYEAGMLTTILERSPANRQKCIDDSTKPLLTFQVQSCHPICSAI